MSIRRLERDDWGGFCIRASRFSVGKQADIEVVSLQIGFQPEAPRLPQMRDGSRVYSALPTTSK